MKLKATIVVSEDINIIEKAFMPEMKSLQKERSSVSLKKNKDTLVFTIKAKDSTALRSTMNGITKLLTVYEKTKGVK
jgi:tRNA threonylcarbamoyladenosine modification (KEOPS) complex  Pcc1 subunit